jgi:hypothetical protein
MLPADWVLYMKSNAFAVVLLLALASGTSAQTPILSQKAPAEPVKAAVEKTGGMALASDRLPSSLDPRVCLEFATSAQVIACAEKYRPRKRSA